MLPAGRRYTNVFDWSVDSPVSTSSVIGIQVDRLLQAGAESATNRGPALARAIVGDEVVYLRCGVQFVLDVSLLELALSVDDLPAAHKLLGCWFAPTSTLPQDVRPTS